MKRLLVIVSTLLLAFGTIAVSAGSDDGYSDGDRVTNPWMELFTTTSTPTEAPTQAPTVAPTQAPTEAPTVAPTEAPTVAPTQAPTEAPTVAPTEAPTVAPTQAPTTTIDVTVEKPDKVIGLTYAGNDNLPYYFAWQASARAVSYNFYVNGTKVNSVVGTAYNAIDYFNTAADGNYTIGVTAVNAGGESEMVTINFKKGNVADPTVAPTQAPTEAPTVAPTQAPTEAPTVAPTQAPTEAPTVAPTQAPTEAPTVAPTQAPTEAPTVAPTQAPTEAPTVAPTQAPTEAPTVAPTQAPTVAPTEAPTVAPTQAPTEAPTVAPTQAPTTQAPTQPTTQAATSNKTENAGVKAEAVEKEILSAKNDKDPAGSTYGKLTAKAKKSTKTSNKITWKKVSGATKYVIYAAKCGTQIKKVKETTGSSFTHKKLKKGKYYKYLVVAVDKNGNVVAISKVIHSATKGGKVGNAKKIKLNKTKVKLSKNKKFKIKAKQVANAKKVKIKNHRKISYESTNNNIATVTSKGVIKAKAKGTCTIYVYSQNGVCAKVKVTVK